MIDIIIWIIINNFEMPLQNIIVGLALLISVYIMFKYPQEDNWT